MSADNTVKKPNTIWNRAFIAVFVVNLFMNMGQQTAHTLIGKFAASLGAAASLIGLIAGLYAGIALALRPFTSPLYDIVNKKYLLAGSIALIAIAYVFFATAKSIPMVIIGRCLQGAGVGCSAPLSMAIVCESLPDDKYGKGVTIFSLAQAFGQAIGPSVGLAISSRFGYSATFWVCTGLMVIAFALCFLCSDTYVAPGSRYRIRFDTILIKDAIPAALLLLLLAMSYSTINALLTIYGGLRNIDNIGLYFTVYAIGLLVLRPLVSGLADRFGYVKVIVPSLVLFSCTFLLFSLAQSIVLIIAAAVVGALGYGMAQPSVQALCMKMVPRDRSGVGANTMFFMQDIGQFLGPTIAGSIVDLFLRSGATDVQAYASTYRCMMIPILAASAAAFLLRNVYRKNMK
ncbi:MAG: MFS transporter [Firmicutes bacterium]|nr:MFS transporter [Bacillota bacterium]